MTGYHLPAKPKNEPTRAKRANERGCEGPYAVYRTVSASNRGSQQALAALYTRRLSKVCSFGADTWCSTHPKS